MHKNRTVSNKNKQLLPLFIICDWGRLLHWVLFAHFCSHKYLSDSLKWNKCRSGCWNMNICYSVGSNTDLRKSYELITFIYLTFCEDKKLHFLLLCASNTMIVYFGFQEPEKKDAFSLQNTIKWFPLFCFFKHTVVKLASLLYMFNAFRSLGEIEIQD